MADDNSCENYIGVVAHREFEVPRLDDCYHVIKVGDGNERVPGYLSDSTGDNISEKNPYYCELTALYWLWKNAGYGKKHLGLCHYRRYFSRSPILQGDSYFLKSRDVDEILGGSDMILPLRYHFRETNREHFVNTGVKAKAQASECIYELDVLKKAIQDVSPGYENDFSFVMGEKRASYHNMMITGKECFDEYCDWLFRVLFETEDMMIRGSVKSVRPRVFGFMSEYLLNVWVRHEGLKVTFLPVTEVGCRMLHIPWSLYRWYF